MHCFCFHRLARFPPNTYFSFKSQRFLVLIDDFSSVIPLFVYTSGLRSHLAEEHKHLDTGVKVRLKNQARNHTCDTCGRSFAFNCLLQDHINLHTGAKPYLCQDCGRAFSQKATLKQHEKTHSEVRKPCSSFSCALQKFLNN